MMKESAFYKILSAIHIILFTSMLCFGCIYLSAALLMLPAFGAVFKIGRDYLGRRLDITDSIVRTYLRYFKASLGLMKFVPINLIMLFNVIAMMVTAKSGKWMYSVVCLSIAALLMVFLIYIAGYHTFVDERVRLMDVILCIFLKPLYAVPVFMITVIGIFSFSGTMMIIIFFTGTLLLFAEEIVVLLQLLFYKKFTGKLKGDEFEYLMNGQGLKGR